MNNEEGRDSNMKTESHLLTAKEVARSLALSVSTLALWRQTGRGPKYLRFGRTVRYEQAEIDVWVEKLKAQCFETIEPQHVSSQVQS